MLDNLKGYSEYTPPDYQSLIHYYQEIGRAGRDNREVGIFLLFNKNNDLSLPESFVRNNRPSEDKYNIVINALRSEPDSMWPLMKKTNLKQTVLRTILADLENQKIIRTVIYGRKKLYELSKKDTSIDFKPFEELRVFKAKVVGYARTSYHHDDGPAATAATAATAAIE